MDTEFENKLVESLAIVIRQWLEKNIDLDDHFESVGWWSRELHQHIARIVVEVIKLNAATTKSILE